MVDKHVLLIRLRHLMLPKPQREQPIGKHRVCCMSLFFLLPILPLWVLPLPLLLSELLIAKGTVMSRTGILPHISGALGEFPNFIVSIPQTSTLRCSLGLSVFVENFSGIFCSLLPLGCWSADSQRVVFDSAQRSRQVKAPDCGER